MPRVPPASLGMGQCQALPLALEGVGNDTEVPLVNRGMEMSEFSLSWVLPPHYLVPLSKE